MSNDPADGDTIAALTTASKGQSSVGVQLLAYCNSVLEQTTVDFTGFANLAKFQTEINAGIVAAQQRADNYVNRIQPAITLNVTNMSNYFDLHQAIATTVPVGASKSEWLDNLAALKDAVDGYREHSVGVVDTLGELHRGLTTDVGSFTKTVNDLNVAVSGDDGVLASLDNELADMDGKIAGAISGIVLSGLAVIGGSILVLVGAFASTVTGGAATMLVVGGAAVIIAGVAGAAGSGVALGALLNEKADLISRKSTLKAEVKLALGMRSGFADLRDQAHTAVQAASAMRNAWEFLGSDLGQLSTDLDKGIIGTDALRKLWLTTANSAIGHVRTDIDTIKQQMIGVVVKPAPAGVSIGDHVAAVAQQLAA